MGSVGSPAYAFRPPGSGAYPAVVELGGGAQLDAFSRLRVAEPVELFSKACEYDNQPLFYQNVLTGGAGQAYSAATTSTTLTVAGGTDSAIRQSRWYVRYRPGKSQQIFVTGNFGGPQVNVVKRIGYFDDDTQPQSTGDGLFFEVDGSGIYAVLRSSTSGSSVDTRVAQADWNLDKLDGTGPSGVTLDLTKEQVVVLDFGWLGSATIRWGFVVNCRVVLVHQVGPANTFTAPFVARPSLPIRWEIASNGGAGSMVATCSSVQSEGGFNTEGVQRAVSMGGTGKTTSATTLVPLLTIRLNATYRRANFLPITFSIITTGASAEPFEVLLLRDATLTGATFAAGAASEAMEYDVAATAITATGQALDRQYGTSGGGPIKGGGAGGAVKTDVPFSSRYDGTRDTLTLAVRPLGTGATTFYGSLIWSEFY
jgi:hypothetical protein